MRPTALLSVVALVLLPGCSVARPIGPIVDAPPTPIAGAATPVVPTPASAEKCDAAQLVWLIGRSRNEIPVPVDPSRRRVACTRCPVTEDYRPDRTTIRYDAQTGIVASVTCG